MQTREKSQVIACTTSGVYNLYTCPKNCRSKVVLVFVTNANGNNTVSISLYKKNVDTSYYILGSKNMSQSDFVQFSGSYLVLEPEDRLDVSITTLGVVDAICTVEETFLGNVTNV